MCVLLCLFVCFAALRRQSNPHWQALFYSIDTSPAVDDLRHIVESFADPRLVVVNQSELTKV